LNLIAGGSSLPEETVNTSEAETPACARRRHAEGMKPGKVVIQVAYVLKQDRAKVMRAESNPHGDERNPCLKLRQGYSLKEGTRKGVWCWSSVLDG
jgi:hypothetical protein